MHVNVPHRYYGECHHFMPKLMCQWLSDYNLQYGMTGGSSWGTGYDDAGITNQETSYVIRNIPTREDCLAFKMQFPHVETFVSECINKEEENARLAIEHAKKEASLKRRRDLYAAKKKSYT